MRIVTFSGVASSPFSVRAYKPHCQLGAFRGGGAGHPEAFVMFVCTYVIRTYSRLTLASAGSSFSQGDFQGRPVSVMWALVYFSILTPPLPL